MTNTAQIKENDSSYIELSQNENWEAGDEFSFDTEEAEATNASHSEKISPNFYSSLRVVENIEAPLMEEIKQKWSGVVTDVSDESFTVKLDDLTNPDNPTEIAVFSKEEIDNSELSKIKVGAMLYWYIGYRQSLKGPKMRISILRFRKLPMWTQSEIDESKRRAALLSKLIDGD